MAERNDMRNILTAIAFLTLFQTVIASTSFCGPNHFFDNRDARCYGTVRIGNQTWMSENLTYRENLPGRVWLVEKVPNYWKIGVYYTWNAAMRACPEGWHLPSVEEWEILFRYVAKNNNYGDAIKKLKTVDGWGSPNDEGNGTDDYGFHAWPFGMVYKDGTFMNVGGSVHYWTTSSGQVAAFPMASDYGGFNFFSSDNGYSVRCLKD